MNELVLLKSTEFNGVALDCYIEPKQQDKGDFWATRTQIGQLLGYSEAGNAIKNIHMRNKERLDKFSRVAQLELPSGGTQDVIVYNFKGLLEICRYSNQPKANDIMDWLFEVADEIRKTGSYSVNSSPESHGLFAIDAAIRILEHNGIKGNQLTLSLDRGYKHCTGFSLLEITGTQLIAPKQEQYLTPTDIGKVFGLKAHRVNEILAGAGYQCKIAGKWQPLELGQPYAVMQDVAKAHGEGTPICQLKWYSSILDVFGELLEQEGFELA